MMRNPTGYVPTSQTPTRRPHLLSMWRLLMRHVPIIYHLRSCKSALSWGDRSESNLATYRRYHGQTTDV